MAQQGKKKKGGAAKVILAVLLVVILTAGGCLLAAKKEINGSASAQSAVSVSIPQGSGVAAIANRLKEAGVIRYPHLFRWYVGRQGAAAKLQYGEFELAPGSSYDAIIAALSAYAAPRTSLRRPTPAISARTGSGSTSRTTRTPPTASSSVRAIFSRTPTTF